MELVKADTPVTPQLVTFKNKTVRGKLWAILPWVVFAVACVLLVVGLIVHYADGLNDDMASELILAKMLSEGKGFIITNQWIYSTELRFLNTQLIFTPLFWLCQSWAVVRILGTVILHGILLLAFYFLLASLQRQNLFPWLATLLLLPTSLDWVTYVNFGAYYLPHLTISFAVLGFLFYAVRAVSKRNFWLLAGGGATLSLLSAVGGFRQVVVLSIPLFLAAVIYYWLNWSTEHKPAARKVLIGSSLALAGALLGLLVNAGLQKLLWFYDWSANLTWQDWSLDGVQTVGGWVLNALGWRSGEKLFSSAMIGNLVAIALIVLGVVAVVGIIKHRDRYAPGVVVMTLFLAMGLAVLVGIYTVVTLGYGYQGARFVLPVTVFIWPVLACYLTQNWQWQLVGRKLKLWLKPAIGVLVLGLILVNGVLTGIAFYGGNAEPWRSPTRNVSLRAIGQTLLDAQCYGGYYLGELSSGGVGSNRALTELSNGKIEVWTLNYGAESLDDVGYWLEPVSHTSEKPAGKTFVLIDNQHAQQPLAQKIINATNSNCLYRDSDFTLYVYDKVADLQAVIATPSANGGTVDAGEVAHE